ncbi:response regulator transcription factor [Polaribacter sp. BAL334]|uniref:LytR/AlgR family response regulator transcription factor n=1 Tax=Polaribacter sp. BAL334 TaxID=1708178 RepID=UPI0018D26DCC|nr:LytTR family DNA-binding domain-containing protein [Polaribacter sp. BAL334]MBG7610984.1 response regulator transcription factor [Polaribacter sp. BAL334]
MSRKLKAYIVEDNIMNVEILKELIDKYYPSISIVGEATNTEEFVELLMQNEADVIFLDIELGQKKNSLDILKEFENIDSEIIIISSSEEYALKALNEHTITSYLLKPINLLDFQKTIQKLGKKLNETIESKTSPNFDTITRDVIAIPGLTMIEIVSLNDILYVEADGKYTKFHLEDGSSKIVSKNIGIYENILPKNLFFRIHHKYILNISKTDNVFRTDGSYCVLKNGKNLPIAKRRMQELRKFLCL